MKQRFLPLALFLCTIQLAVADELGRPDGSPVRLGDTVETVKQALNTTLDPEKDEQVGFPGMPFPQSTSLQLKTKGIRVFFNTEKKVKTVRFDLPFKGEIKGIRIGDPKEKIIEKLGEPTKKQIIGTREMNYFYFPDDITTLNFMFGMDNKVETIFIAK